MTEVPVPAVMQQKKFQISYLIKGPGETALVPHKHNPIAGVNLASVLVELSSNLPQLGFGMEIIGVSVKEV